MCVVCVCVKTQAPCCSTYVDTSSACFPTPTCWLRCATRSARQCHTSKRRASFIVTSPRGTVSSATRMSSKLATLDLRGLFCQIFAPIPWGHGGPLCHALSLSSSSSWTSMRACDISDTWWMGVRRLTVANGPNIYLLLCFYGREGMLWSIYMSVCLSVCLSHACSSILACRYRRNTCPPAAASGRNTRGLLQAIVLTQHTWNGGFGHIICTVCPC